MRKKGNIKKITKFVSDIREFASEVNFAVKDATGKDIKTNLEEAMNNANKIFIGPPEQDPYTILGVKITDDQKTVKGVYMAMVKVFHESGSNPNEDKMKLYNVAYEEICEEKGWSK